MVIAVDAFGSDNAPFVEVAGAVKAVKKNICSKILLVGKKDVLTAELEKLGFAKNPKIEIVDATEVISMNDLPARAFKKKRDSSLVKAVELVRDKKADAVVSAGNTGAVMSISLFLYGRIKNISRPAIASVFPSLKKPSVVIDVGANVDSKPHNLVQSAILGSLYSSHYLKIDKPRVSLFNIGEEEKKGNELTREAYQLLKKENKIDFIGNIEGKELFLGKSDVIVCDGFTGNVVLKTAEGTVGFLYKLVKRLLKKNPITIFGLPFFIPILLYAKKNLSPSKHGGALLTGLDGVSIIAHGSSNSTAIKNAIVLAKKVVDSGFIEDTKDFFQKRSSKI